MAAVVLSGCPRSREGGGGGDVPIESLPSEVARTYCDLLFRCSFSNEDTIALKLLFGDRSTCAGYLERTVFGAGELDALMRAAAEGTVTYDPAAARACIASIGSGCAAAVTGAELGDEATCDDVFVGTVAEGGACFLDEECAGELGCSVAGGMCPGTCAPAGGGFPCGGTAACPAGQECFFPEVGTERCVTEIVGPDAAEGQPCGLVSETDTEVTRRGCAPGLWCTGDSYTIGMCRAPIAAGAACSGSGEVCVDGHLCADGTCRAVTIRRTEGAPCDETMLTVCDPLARLECVDGTCVAFTDGASGSPCNTGDFGELTCNTGLVCHGATDTCGTPAPAGSLCESDRECASGDCDSATGTCRERYCDE